MSCDHPLLRIFTPDILTAKGKPETVKMIGFRNFLDDRQIDDYYKKLVESLKDNQIGVVWKDIAGRRYGHQLIPCGQCIGCRLEYSRQWAMRCTLEALQHECNYFLTLTYDELSVPTNPFSVGCDPDTGEVIREGHSHPLRPEHLTKFMKDLREYWRTHLGHDGIRFFACGEYGGKTGRPHFHIILFNCPILDMTLYKRNFQDKPLYNSPTIDKLWKKGYCVIAECNFDTCAYVARYIMKKQTGDHKVMYDIMDLTPEFTRMSRMPGIGRTYYDQNSGKIYKYDQITIVGSKGQTLQPCPPKYFDRIYADEEPEDFERIKNDRLLKMAVSERSREYETGLNKATHIRLQTEQRDRVLIALKRVN